MDKEIVRKVVLEAFIESLLYKEITLPLPDYLDEASGVVCHRGIKVVCDRHTASFSSVFQWEDDGYNGGSFLCSFNLYKSKATVIIDAVTDALVEDFTEPVYISEAKDGETRND